MDFNNFELGALMLCSCLLGIIVSIYNMSNFLTEREVMLMSTLYLALIAFVYTQQYNKQALLQYFSQHRTEIEQRQLTDLQEVHRRRILVLKSEHVQEIRHLQDSIHAANAKFDRTHAEHNWISGVYQDQMRTVQEQEDRIGYLERKLQEFGQNSPATLPPYSAPSSTIQFANPPRRLRSSTAADLASPLAQVSEVSETEQ